MAEHSVVGKAVPRIDALAKVTGKTSYTCDIEFPGMLVGRILRSPLPHAKIVRIDTSKAEKLRGVKAVITGDDFPNTRYGHFVIDQPPLARDKVRYVGEKVAAVAAIDLATAQEAIDLIEVEYEELKPVFDPEEALKPDAPMIHEDIDKYHTTFDTIIKYHNVCSRSGVVRGNIEEGFAQADFIFEDTFTTPKVHQAQLEPHSAIAQVDPSGKVTVWTVGPSVFNIRHDLSEALGLPINMIKVIAGPVGGSFGSKNDMRLEPTCALLAKKSGRVVKMTLDREEEFADGAPRHASIIHLKTGVMKDGRIIARQARMIFDTGAYTEFGPAVASEAAKQISGPYRIPHLDVDSLCVYTNKISSGCFRCHGTPQPTFAYESQMDIIAAKLGIDPLEMRLRNAVVDGDHAATGELYSGITLKENLQKIAERTNWGTNKKARNRGIGIACGQWRTGGRQASVILKMDENGKVTVTTGSVDVTGSHTVISQIVGEELGIKLSEVQIIPIDTDNAPFDPGSSGTRTTHAIGGVVQKAAAQIREQIFDLAAEMLEANRADLEIENGRVFIKGVPEKGLAIARVAQQAFRSKGGPIVETASTLGIYAPPDPKVLRGLCFSGAIEFLHPVQVVEVEVDTDTGEVRVISLVSAHDIGKAINPASAAGQVHGGAAQGIGYALYEELLCQDGMVLNPNGAPYPQPTASDLPVIDVMLIEDTPGRGPYGAKGIAETPIVPTAPAIANAIYDAIGIRIKSLPITPDKILEALAQKPAKE